MGNGEKETKIVLKDGVALINLNNVGSQEECKHSFYRVLIGNDVYWQCSKCGCIYQCEHDWIQEYRSKNFMIYRCSKCNIDVLSYKCLNCGSYTPHWFVRVKGIWQSGFETKPAGTLEEYKCLICGRFKTIRIGGSFARMR
jgi:hypothetical protein